MKYTAKVFLCFIIMSFLVACGSKEEKTISEVTEIEIYYLNKEETKIVTEPLLLQTKETDTQAEEVLSALARPPETVTNKAPISDFKILSYRIEDGQIKLKLEGKYKELGPAREVLTRAAIVRTLTQIEGIDYVSMQLGDENLTDVLGNPLGVMAADTFVDNTGDEINAYEKATLRLYFADESGTRLIEVMRPDIVFNSNISMEKLVLEQLIKGPNIDNVYPVINPATKVISVTVKDGVCYVNLKEDFLTQVYNVSSDVTIYAITNSLVELPNVNKVQISIEGNYEMVYRENISLTTVFERNLEIVGNKEEKEENE